MPITMRIVLLFICALFVATLGVGVHEAYATKEVDPLWPLLCLGYLWMLNDIKKGLERAC